VNTKKGKYFLYGLVVMCCLMYEVPIRSKKMKDNPAIVNLYKQTGRTNTQKNMDELFVRFLLK
jgi:hypothetical protein